MSGSDAKPSASTAEASTPSAAAAAARSRRPRADRKPAEPPAERTVDETIALYRDEWILMKVSGFDEDGWPERGLVLAHSPHRGDISKALAKEPPRSERPPDAPYEPYYIYNAFPRGRGPILELSTDEPQPSSNPPQGERRAREQS